jgi:hypothetical protein
MFEDPLFWVFVIPGLLLGLYAQWRIKLNVAKYSQVATQGEARLRVTNKYKFRCRLIGVSRLIDGLNRQLARCQRRRN